MTKDKITQLAKDHIGLAQTALLEGWELVGDIHEILDVPLGKITGHDIARIGERLEAYQQTLKELEVSEEADAFRRHY